METTTGRNNNKFAKLCRNGCGKHIRWDTVQNKYLEIDTNDRHRCPNWNLKQEHFEENASHKITPGQQIYVDTIGPIILDIHSEIRDIKQILKQILILIQEQREESGT